MRGAAVADPEGLDEALAALESLTTLMRANKDDCDALAAVVAEFAASPGGTALREFDERTDALPPEAVAALELRHQARMKPLVASYVEARIACSHDLRVDATLAGLMSRGPEATAGAALSAPSNVDVVCIRKLVAAINGGREDCAKMEAHVAEVLASDRARIDAFLARLSDPAHPDLGPDERALLRARATLEGCGDNPSTKTIVGELDAMPTPAPNTETAP
jgi:hypothetical protein